MSARHAAAVLTLTTTAFLMGRSTGLASSQDMDAKAMEAGWDALGQTGRMHRLLEPFVGTWQAAGTFYMPDGELETQGTMETRWILGGKFLEQRYHTDEMMGAPFDGLSLWGYSSAAETFQSLWIDSMTTHIDFNETMEVSEDGKTFRARGEQYIAPGMTMPYVDHIEIKNENEHVFTRSIETPGGLEPSWTIVYTR